MSERFARAAKAHFANGGVVEPFGKKMIGEGTDPTHPPTGGFGPSKPPIKMSDGGEVLGDVACMHCGGMTPGADPGDEGPAGDFDTGEEPTESPFAALTRKGGGR